MGGDCYCSTGRRVLYRIIDYIAEGFTCPSEIKGRAPSNEIARSAIPFFCAAGSSCSITSSSRALTECCDGAGTTIPVSNLEAFTRF